MTEYQEMLRRVLREELRKQFGSRVDAIRAELAALAEQGLDEILKSLLRRSVKAIPARAKVLNLVEAAWAEWTTNQNLFWEKTSSATGIGGKKVVVHHFSGRVAVSIARAVGTINITGGLVWLRLLDPAGVEVARLNNRLDRPMEFLNVDTIELKAGHPARVYADTTNPVYWRAHAMASCIYEVYE